MKMSFMQRDSIKKGLGFGLTSAIITTLGLIVGLNSGTHSRTVILSSIIVIAIADAFSDSLAMHISEEAGNKKVNPKEVWESTISTFLFKFIFAFSFIIPLLLFNLQTAIIVSIVWGLSILGIFSFYVAKEKKINPFKVIAEHLIIAVLVIVLTNFIGNWVSGFG